MFSHVLVIVGVIWFGGGGVEGLEDYDNFSEGACLDIHHQHRHLIRPGYPNVDATWVDTLHFNSAGSKYHMFKMASPHPRYHTMKEDEFYYDFCYSRNTSSQEPVAVGYGFGRVLETWDVRTRPEIPGLYIEATPRNHFPRYDVLQQRVTLTDHKTFAFLLDCWVASNKKAWNIVSNTQKLSEEAKRVIQEHAVSLGFNPKNFVFLRYDSCDNNPFPGLPRPPQRRDDRGEGRWGRGHPPKNFSPAPPKFTTTTRRPTPPPTTTRKPAPTTTGWSAPSTTTKWTPPPTTTKWTPPPTTTKWTPPPTTTGWTAPSTTTKWTPPPTTTKWTPPPTTTGWSAPSTTTKWTTPPPTTKIQRKAHWGHWENPYPSSTTTPPPPPPTTKHYLKRITLKTSTTALPSPPAKDEGNLGWSS